MNVTDEQMIEYLCKFHSIEQLASKLLDKMASGEVKKLEKETAQFLKDNAEAAIEKRGRAAEQNVGRKNKKKSR